jgi:putative cell wall-binding protein
MIDALSASPVAYNQGDPLLLVNTGQTSISSATLAAMQQAGITNVVILGETAAVAPGIQTQLASTFGSSSVIRLGGADRDQTAIAIDQHFFTHPTGVIVAANGADGGSFVDALSASALASMNDVPIVLSNPTGLPSSTEGYLKSVTLQVGWVMGGPLALTSNVATELGSYMTAP